MRIKRGIAITLLGAAVLALGLYLHSLPPKGWAAGNVYAVLNSVCLFVGVVGGTAMVAGALLFFFALTERAKENAPKPLDLADIDQMTGEEFEQLLQKLFTAEGATVNKTKQSRDYGADLLLVLDGKSVAVQAKRYSEKVSVTAVQEVAAARTYYGTDQAWIVTSNYFTQSARELALACNVRLFDRNDVKRLIEQKE